MRVRGKDGALIGFVPKNEALSYDQSLTPSGTVGAQTIHKSSGTVNFAAGAASLVVTNRLASPASTIYCSIRTNDSTAQFKNAVPGTGTFTIHLSAAAGAETSVGFLVVN